VEKNKSTTNILNKTLQFIVLLIHNILCTIGYEDIYTNYVKL